MVGRKQLSESEPKAKDELSARPFFDRREKNFPVKHGEVNPKVERTFLVMLSPTACKTRQTGQGGAGVVSLCPETDNIETENRVCKSTLRESK